MRNFSLAISQVGNLAQCPFSGRCAKNPKLFFMHAPCVRVVVTPSLRWHPQYF